MATKLTTEEFIKKAREVHGDKYDYSKVEYVNANTKVCIICSEHGEFWQWPVIHLKGHGCRKCIQPNAYMSTNEFIAKAKAIHGNKYDYSKVAYNGIAKKVCIICPEHGEFWQTPANHLKGQGCRKCAGKYNMSTEDFIKKAKEVHGDKYDYSKVEYKSNKTKVCIICPEHGKFWQEAKSHLNGYGCKKCANEKLSQNKSQPLEEFISRAKKAHGDKYDYSKVEYKNCEKKVCIICPEHGKFWQKPKKHLLGQGCPKCVGNIKLTTEDFIVHAREVHGNKYDYTKVVYENSDTRVCIICPEHGEFWQRPYCHLKGQGCPNCYGLRKAYKFNLLEEFEDEYEFRAFLDNNDTNILYAILQNIEPKYEPLKKDLQKALINIDDTNPMKSLKDKYTSDDDEEEVEDVVSEDETKETTESINDIDFDDEEALNNLINKLNEKSEGKDENGNPTNLSIEDVISNREKELKVIARIEHTLTPEVREYIKRKFLNDKMRMWMASRETQKN